MIRATTRRGGGNLFSSKLVSPSLDACDLVLTESTNASTVMFEGGVIHVRLATPFNVSLRLTMPWMTASLSCSSRRYGGVDTMVFSCLVMVIRPRDREPVPRYWVTVIDAAYGASKFCQPANSALWSKLTVEFALNSGLPLEMARDAVASLYNLPELDHVVNTRENTVFRGTFGSQSVRY